MIKKNLYLCLILLIALIPGSNAQLRAVEFREEGKIITPDRIPLSQSITIDGVLDEPAWSQSPLDLKFVTVKPNFGESLGQETKIWTAYDRENLYFAFLCYDTEPGKIKTSIAQRENISMDDLVGVFLDALGNKQTSYEFYCNPSGIQWDAITSAISGPDQSPDFVWYSAGKITEQGYQVEMRIPLESIRYRSSKETKMGIMFFRQVSRMGMYGTWPALEPGQTDFNLMAAIIYNDLKGTVKLEILPNITYTRNSQRETADTFIKDSETDVGIGIKYGITSAMTVEATVNPDFSQVESDVFQAEVNRRYPVFYTEKRPFFMESKEVLDFGIIQQGMMVAPIHTRLIVNPDWAAKFSGTTGRLNFALLAANDRVPGETSAAEDRKAFFGIFRAKYNIGSDNSLGILYTGRHQAGEKNDVAGIDLKYRLSKYLRASLSFLYSATREAEELPQKEGTGWNAMLEYSRPTFSLVTAYERYEPDFFMATAFQNRVGIDRGFIQLGPLFNMKIKNLGWLRRIAPYIHLAKLHDLETKMDDTVRVLGVNLGFAPLGEITIEYRDEDETWARTLFSKRYLNSTGYIQLFKGLHLTGSFLLGEQIYYDMVNPFVGNSKTIQLGFTVQPGVKLKLELDYLYSDLYEKQDHRKVYSINITNLQATYQFNKYFFLRGILRYDDNQEKLLTDILASFTFIPGTVVHLGYGSLYLRNQWQNGHWIEGQGDLLKMREGIFFKASYLLRL